MSSRRALLVAGVTLAAACGSGLKRDPLAGAVAGADAAAPVDLVMAGGDGGAIADAPPAAADVATDAPGPDAEETGLPPDLAPDLIADLPPPGSPGAECERREECHSRNCVDGRCCQVARCMGDCMLCLGPGGTCVSTTSTPLDPSRCARDHGCDATYACKKLGGEPCTKSDECLGGTCTDGDTCTCTLCFEPALFHAGSVPLGMTASFPLNIRNHVDPGTPFETVMWPLSDHTAFFALPSNTCALTGIAAKETCSLNMLFRPRALMSFLTILELQRGGVVLDRVTIAGEGVPADHPYLRHEGQFIGEAAPGAGGRSFPFILVNPPTGVDVTPMVFDIHGRDRFDFTVSENACAGRVIPPGGECQFWVRFQPAILGGMMVALLWVSGDNFHATLGIQGRAIPP